MASSSAGSTASQASPAPSTSASTTMMAAEEAIPLSASSSTTEKISDEGSKLRIFVGILRKFIGVADIASVRFSLPAQLLEPTPNLEYWNYLDRPETFISIGDSNNELERILAVLRFWFTKDLKYIKGKPCKPYNSTLGEFFRCNWEVEDNAPPIMTNPSEQLASSNSSIAEGSKRLVKVSFLTEQTSHHPPVSAFYVDCPEKGITAKGFDQISAKFTGTSIRVTPGAHNLGIFITLHKRNDEQYQLTHPSAHIGGVLRGILSISVTDLCFISCPKTRIKVILHYLEEGWLGKTQNKVEGVVFKYQPDNDKITKYKDIPELDILARIEGNWAGKLYYSLGSSKQAEKTLLIDLLPLFPIPKIVPPESMQLPNESRKFWRSVTGAIISKKFNEATRLKQELEERQREKAAARKEKGEEWAPRFFTAAVTPVGKPDLSKEGEIALKGLHNGDYALEPSNILGA